MRAIVEQQSLLVARGDMQRLFRARKAVLKYLTCSFALIVFHGFESFNGNERAFAEKYAWQDACEYAIHGGGVPPRVHRIEGVVGIIVVSGLSQGEAIRLWYRRWRHC
jgi:uncharacterized protein (UPF0303 family)